MHTSPPPRSAAFTLIELLAVIAIIGILAAVVIPTVGKVRDTAQRTVDANNLREIAKAATLYATDHHDLLPGINLSATTFRPEGNTTTTTPHVWAAALAASGILTDPEFYSSKLDPHRPQIMPGAILDSGAEGSTLNTEFASMVLSVELVGGLRMTHPASTPVAFTRGLQTNGRWDAASGVYGEAGGYVALLGGSIAYHRSLEAPDQIPASNGRPTSNLLQALPFNAAATTQNPNPRIYADTTLGGLGSATGETSVAPPQ